MSGERLQIGNGYRDRLLNDTGTTSSAPNDTGLHAITDSEKLVVGMLGIQHNPREFSHTCPSRAIVDWD